ncbi:MAG TPA: hypothetical protein VF189_01215 [Patescibacteria group bacterium]
MGFIEGDRLPQVSRWIFITGSRKNTPESLKIVRQSVANIMKDGGAIVVGAGDGADVAAIKEALIHDPKGDRLKVFLVSDMPSYRASRVNKLSDPNTPVEQITSIYELIETLDRVAQLKDTVQVTKRVPDEGEDPTVKYDTLNVEMVNYVLANPGLEKPITLFFRYGSARGTNAAIESASRQLDGRVFDGLDPKQNPYYPQ